jgi:hypothetical protein
MKIKNAILGIVSLLFAAGSAFASFSAATPEYANVLYSDATTWICTKVPTCPVGSVQPCTVVFNSLPTTPAPVYDVINAAPSTQCTVLKTTISRTTPTVNKPRIVEEVR